MMYCPNCGVQLNADAVFCSGCGFNQKKIRHAEEVDKTDQMKPKKGKMIFGITVVVLAVIAVVAIGIFTFYNNQLTVEDVREKFVQAQALYIDWYIDPFVNSADIIEDGYRSYCKVKGEIDTREEVIEVLAEHFSYDVCEEVLDDCYVARNGSLYFSSNFYGTEGDTVITSDKLYKTAECWFYEFESTFYDGYDGGRPSEREPIVIKIIKQNGKWVFDDFSVYFATYKYE